MMKIYTPFNSHLRFASVVPPLLFLGLLLFMQLSVNAATSNEFVTFQGVALDSETNQPLAFSRVVVFINDERVADATTDEYGHFTIEVESGISNADVCVKIKGEPYLDNHWSVVNTDDLNVCQNVNFDAGKQKRSRNKKYYYSFCSIGCPSF